MFRSYRAGILFAALGAVTLTCSAQADPIVFGNPNWYEFTFSVPGVDATTGVGDVPSSGGNSEYAPDAPWTFTAPSNLTLTVTDAFLKGDSFEVFDFGTSIGTTPLVASGSSTTDDPAVAVLDSTYSHNVFLLGAGNHSITIQPISTVAPAGAAYFRTDAAATPEPGSLALLLVSGIGGAGYLRRRRRK